MKNIVPIVICVVLLIGGSMMMAPAVTTSVPATYAVVADPAPPIPQGDLASSQPPVVQQGIKVKIPDGLLMPKAPVIPPWQDQMALNRPVCPSDECTATVTTVDAPVNACDAVATADREVRRPLRAVTQAGGAVVRVAGVVLGRDRRVERREARRGG